MTQKKQPEQNKIIDSLVDYSNKSTVKRGYSGDPIMTLLASVGNYTWARLYREVQLAW